MKLALLVYGSESEKNELEIKMNILQAQLNKLKRDDEAEVVFVINSEETIESMKSWLVSQTAAKKYCFIDANTCISDNFVICRLSAVKCRQKTEDLLEKGVFSK